MNRLDSSPRAATAVASPPPQRTWAGSSAPPSRSAAAVAAPARPNEATSGTRRDLRQVAWGSLSKVAPVTLAFWVVKICATILGETGGDALSMTLNLGYAVSTLIFLAFFAVTLVFQLRSRRYHPLAYWAVVVATTTVGTTTSDLLDRTLGRGYVTSSIIELGLVVAVLAVWRLVTGTIAVDHISSRKNEAFYWLTILVANTLGTALGDFTATTTGIGFEGGALIFAGLLAVVAALHVCTGIPRPLGATLGDTLTKSHAAGGLALSRITSSLAIAAVMAVIVALTHRRRRVHPGELFRI